jgi:hypothetical protein
MIRSLLARAEARIPSVSAAAQQFGIYRKRRREVEDADGSYAETLKSQPQQTIHLEFQDFRMACETPRRPARGLILVGASGYSFMRTRQNSAIAQSVRSRAE